MAAPSNRSGAVSAELGLRLTLRQRQQAWVKHILVTHNLNYVQFAKACGIDRTNLTRLFASESTHVLRSDTVEKITKRFGPMEGQAAASTAASPGKVRGFIEAAPYAANDDTNLEAVIGAITAYRSGCSPFELRSDALMTLGYLRGDILFVDQNAKPAPGDVVCVQLYNWDGSTAGTVYYVYQVDWLVLPGGMGEPPPAPIKIDGANLTVMGPVTEMLRPRRSANLPTRSVS